MPQIYVKSLPGASCAVAAMVVLLVCCPALAQQKPEQKAPQKPPSTVQVAAAVERMVQPVTTLPGTVISRQDTILTAELDGRLEKITDVGETGKAGEVAGQRGSGSVADLSAHCAFKN